jgi:competence protein ComEC
MTSPGSALGTPDVELHFLNVGQGDTTVLVDHSQRVAAIIDCNRVGEQPVELLLRNAHAELTAAFISHFHADHFEAIPNILRRHDSTAVYCNRSVAHLGSRDQRAQVRAFKRWLADEQTKGRPRDTVDEGDQGRIGLISWRCLAPNTQLLDSAEGYVSENRTSIVLLLTLPSLSIVLAADADTVVLQHLLTNYSDPVDVLRIPHHGGALTGLLDPADVVDVYRPKIRVVSVGTLNQYGHADARWLNVQEPSNRVLCTQVTAACHGSSLASPTVCAGNVTVQWWRNGEWRVTPDVAAHLAVIKGWDHPCCITPDDAV